MFYDQYITYFQAFCAHSLGLHSLSDCLEVMSFITITYLCLNWLKQDHTKNLLLGSYAYFCLLVVAHLSFCNILFATMLFGAPICIVFALIIHQKQLQKNFVLATKQQFSLAITPQKNWIETLIQSCLIASHQQKKITCIIERSQNLGPLLDTPFLLQLPIQQDIIPFLLASSKITDHSIFWIHESGIIESVNVTWSNVLKNEIIIKPHTTTALTHEAALLLTAKTDALIFSLHTAADTHTIWYQGTSLKQATIQHVLQSVKNIISTPSTTPVILKKRTDHDQSSAFTS